MTAEASPLPERQASLPGPNAAQPGRWGARAGQADAGTAVAAALPVDPTPAPNADSLRALYVQAPATLIGNLLGVVLLVITFWGEATTEVLGGWVAFCALLWLARLLHYLRFRRQPQASDAQLLAWRSSWRLLVLGQGSMWGLAVWLFWGLGTPYHSVGLILIVYSYCLGAVQLLSTQRLEFLAFVSLVLVPTIVRIASDSSHAWNLQLAVILSLLFVITVFMARTYGTALGQAIALKRRTEELAAQLRVEAGIAEQARRAAEAASQAKTQFFAAASHDLRQPLHAMGLFAEALRSKSRDPEVAALVNSINESVDALDGLFSELLDITRIDTGGVDVQPAPVRLRELFARLRLHFEPIAFEKGLMLAFHGEQHVVQADPVLLERVLRNLVSNAIRYSDDGGVLVSCRPREGGYLMQVWDTGIGISKAALPRIFDEFYQVQSQRPLQAHQRKGLGLGLAIVKRLIALMGSEIGVRSRVGRGTVFSFLVPAGRVQRSIDAQPPAGLPKPLGLTLNGHLVVVVEDEAAVREGLVVLLQAWGARVQSFDTVPALQAWLASAQAETPDLLLVDYRLPQGTTGIDALVALRGRWPGRHLPAIMVTGSSLGGHEAEALQHDYHLLIKPVLPNKLRAMIGFKLGMR